jgi:hypothetical protein
LKAIKKKRPLTYQVKPIRIIVNSSTQILNTKKKQKDLFQGVKENNCQTKLVFPAKLSCIIEGEMKIFHNK